MPVPLPNLGIVECLSTGKMPVPLPNLGIVERAGEPAEPKNLVIPLDNSQDTPYTNSTNAN